MVLESRTQKGRQGEAFVERHLKELGHCIVTRNWRCRSGEIDLITLQHDVVVFVEVKSRTGCDSTLDASEWGPSKAQQRRLIQAAHCFLVTHQRLGIQWRFDLVLLRVTRATFSLIHHWEGVFDVVPSHPKRKPKRQNLWVGVR